MQTLRTFIRLYPIHKLRLLRLCHQRQTLLTLIFDFLDQSTINLLLSILSHQKQRVWFKKCQNDDLIHHLLRNLFELYRNQQCSIHTILKITGLLYVYCGVR